MSKFTGLLPGEETLSPEQQKRILAIRSDERGSSVRDALRQAEAFIADELRLRKLTRGWPGQQEQIKSAEDALLAVRDALRELR